jgi:ATP-dependent Clp protease ATP-binding subunit ClpB
MRMDKLTTQFQQALADAQSLAVGKEHQFIEPVHVLSALLEQRGSVVGILTKAGVNLNVLRAQLGDALDRLASVEGTPGEVHIGKELSNLLNVTDKLAQERGDSYISSELFLLAALQAKGDLGRMLEKAGGVKGAIAKAIDEVRGGGKVDDQGAEEKRQALEKYTIDLTARAEQQKLDPGHRPR